MNAIDVGVELGLDAIDTTMNVTDAGVEAGINTIDTTTNVTNAGENTTKSGREEKIKFGHKWDMKWSFWFSWASKYIFMVVVPNTDPNKGPVECKCKFCTWKLGKDKKCS